MKAVRIVQFGLGSLGLEIIKVLQKKEFKLVGVIDNDRNLVGKDVGTLALKSKLGIKVTGGIDLAKIKPDIVLHATTSDLNDAFSQIAGIVKHGIDIISTCEQLVYPYTSKANAKLAKKMHDLAKKHGARILGVGVNPGFVMDSLVLMLTSLCSRIDRIRIERVVDVAKRRKALQKKMCLGLTVREFEKVKSKVGHVGLIESAHMISDALHVKPTFRTSIRPVVANRVLRSYDVTIEPGQIAGLEHRLIGKVKNERFLEMILYMFAGASEFDLMEIEGMPPLSVRTNGIQGDQATIALLLNYIPIVMNASSGLLMVRDLPLPRFS
ncbi:MAG: hypothetical protein ACE5J2_06620 [Nitrososphaerales archaeon]